MIRAQQLTYIVLCVAGRDRSPWLNYQDTGRWGYWRRIDEHEGDLISQLLPRVKNGIVGGLRLTGNGKEKERERKGSEYHSDEFRYWRARTRRRGYSMPPESRTRRLKRQLYPWTVQKDSRLSGGINSPPLSCSRFHLNLPILTGLIEYCNRIRRSRECEWSQHTCYIYNIFALACNLVPHMALSKAWG